MSRMGKGGTDYLLERECQICGKRIYPNAVYAYKLTYRGKVLYTCRYNHFRELQKKIDGTDRRGKTQKEVIQRNSIAEELNGYVKTRKGHPVVEIDADGKKIMRYNSMKRVATITGRSFTYVYRHLTLDGVCNINGRRFIFEEEYNAME